LLRLDYLVPLPTDKRPNFDANASVAVKDPAYDPGNAFTMAWQSGLTGIGWDPEQVKALRPSKPEITSVMDLFDPAFAGKVGMFNNSADLAGLVMVGQGVDPATSTPDQWQAAADLMTQQQDDGVVRGYYDQSYTSALQNGDLAVTMAWSGDLFQMNLEGDASGLQFCVPDEGVIIWTDNMCIPLGAEDPVDAITYMDYVYQPDVQATIESYVNYICPVPAAKDVIAPEFADSPLIFPTAEDLAKTHTYYAFKTPEELNEWNAIFQPIYQG